MTKYLKTASAGAVLVSVALIGCATTGKCGTQGCPSDAEITRKVQAQLDQRADFGAPGTISVQTVDHVVYLSGNVSVNSMRRAAANVAQRVSGVTRVENTIAVTP
jgi:osmotically-inducible protein OsmY